MSFNPQSTETYDLLMRRRSVKTGDMSDEGPDRATTEKILAAGMRVPDHGKIAPWRFIVLEGEEQQKLGNLIAHALVAENVSNPDTAEKMKTYATQAPTLIVAISSPDITRTIPEWEQRLSVGAACQNMLVAATALGFGGQWLTGWASFSPTVAKGLGLTGIEQIAGLMFFGKATREPTERPRPVFDEKVMWGFPGGDTV